MGSRCFGFLWELGVEVRPWQASVLAVCSSCGNKRGTSESKEFSCELVVGVAAPSDPVGSIFSRNPS